MGSKTALSQMNTDEIQLRSWSACNQTTFCRAATIMVCHLFENFVPSSHTQDYRCLRYTIVDRFGCVASIESWGVLCVPGCCVCSWLLCVCVVGLLSVGLNLCVCVFFIKKNGRKRFPYTRTFALLWVTEKSSAYNLNIWTLTNKMDIVPSGCTPIPGWYITYKWYLWTALMETTALREKEKIFRCWCTLYILPWTSEAYKVTPPYFTWLFL